MSKGRIKEKIRNMNEETKREVREDMMNGLPFNEAEKKYNLTTKELHYIIKEYLDGEV